MVKKDEILNDIRMYAKKQQKYKRMMPSARHNQLKDLDEKVRQNLKKHGITGW